MLKEREKTHTRKKGKPVYNKYYNGNISTYQYNIQEEKIYRFYIEKSIDLGPSINNLYYTASSIFEDAKEYEISQKYGRKYLEKLHYDELDRKLYILRRLIIININFIINSETSELHYNKFCQLETGYFHTYKLAMEIDNPNNE